MKAHESKEKQEYFVELRGIRGMSLDSICKEIDISKTTALSWDREHKEAIESMKSAHIKLLVDTYELGLAERLKELRSLSERIRAEINDRSLSEVQTDRLISLYLETSKRIETLIERHHLEKTSPEGGSHQKVQSIEDWVRQNLG